MEDISIIDQRVKNLEYNVVLNSLERKAADTIIQDVDGLDRTKYGILADTFTSHLLGDYYNPDYLCAVDVDGSFSPTGGILMPGSMTYYNKLDANSATSVNISRHEDKITLAYKTVPAISQGVATKSIPLNSYQYAVFRGQIITTPENDRWKDTTYLPPDVIDIPPPKTIYIDRTQYITNTIVVEKPGPTVEPPPATVSVDRLMLDGGSGLRYNSSTKAFNNGPYSPYNYDSSGNVQTVGMSVNMFLRQIQAEARNSGYCAAVGMSETNITLTIADWVNDAYRTTLDRPGEVSGIAFWCLMAAYNKWTKGQTELEIAKGGVTSGESAGILSGTGASVNLIPWRVLKDNGVYESTAGKQIMLGNNILINGPDSSGIDTVQPPTGLTSSGGGTLAGVGASATSQGLTLDSWVENLYGTILNRASDAAGKAYWMQKLASHELNQYQVIDYFYASPEFTGRSPQGTVDIPNLIL